MTKLTTIIFIVSAFLCFALQAQEVELGEAYVIGTTWWTTQSNSTVSKMIAIDDEGGLHFTYTYAPDDQISSRHIRYNFVPEDADDIGAELEGNESQVDNAQRAGYAALDLMGEGDDQAAVCFYHGFGEAEMAVDFARGFGAFIQVLFDAPGQTVPLSTKGTIDSNGWAHLVAGTHDFGGNDPTFPLVI